MRKDGKQSQTDYNQSFADIMSVLAFILILIILLLILLFRWHQFDEPQREDVAAVSSSSDEEDPERFDEEDDEEESHSSGGGSDSDDEDDEEEQEWEEHEQDPNKCAILAILVDGDTKKQLKEKDVDFNLLAENSRVMTLYDYYPEKVDYKIFTTTNNGTFYLPEKIPLGKYAFKALNEPKGYDLPEDTVFDVTETLDWPEALEVRIPVYPARNLIRIKQIDKETGDPVPGGVYTITAVKNVVTADGTTRYKQGQEVDTVAIQDDGTGASKEIYLSDYRITQTESPGYFVVSSDDINYSLKKRTEKGDPVTVELDKTTVAIHLVDELTREPIVGAAFDLKENGKIVKTIETDESGTAIFDMLKKNVSYQMQEKNAPEGYRTSDPISFEVEKDGRIGGEAHASYEATNRTLRLSVDVRDSIFNSRVNGKEISLKDPAGKVVRNWTSGDSSVEISGLSAGVYSVSVNGREAASVEVQDKPEITEVTIKTGPDIKTILFAGGTGLMAIIALILTIIIIRKKRKKRG